MRFYWRAFPCNNVAHGLLGAKAALVEWLRFESTDILVTDFIV